MAQDSKKRPVQNIAEENLAAATSKKPELNFCFSFFV
jgi:hypothetical protein